ncbi:MAG: glycosyltransferase family 4 protein [Gemmatimonadetes bacterium]|nr:glycosyltransferase family 4 protein [Gemmatimonadota bacterium]
MRIGVDACCWTNGRGYGRFTRELLRQMVALAPEDEFVCFLDPWAAERFDLEAPNVRTVTVDLSAAPTAAAAADGYRSPLDLWRLTRAVAREPLDVFFSPSVYTYFPLPPQLAAVVTVHDAIADRFPELTMPTLRARLFWRGKVRLALQQARLVLTVSDFAAREIAEVLRVEPGRIRVAVEAPAPTYRPSDAPAQVAAAAARAGLPAGARWFLYVGGFNPHKHLDVLVRAHAAVARDHEEDAPHLLLVGTTDGDVFHQEIERIREEIDAAGTGQLVHWPGFVPDEELRHLHSGAVALVLPSECEGFGLPAVEAAACGTPVIATLQSPLPELLEGGGIFLPPRDEAALTVALRTLLTDELARRRLGARARARARQLSWTRSARAALDALHEAAA